MVLLPMKAYLQFETRWAIESNYDYIMISASADGGSTWNPLCGKHTKNGSTYQAHLQPIYDGQQSAWIQEQMDLGDYLGQHVLIKYELVSDGAVDYDGFYIDDVIITTVEDSPTTVKANAKLVPSISISPNPAHETIVLNVNGYSFSAPLKTQLFDCTGKLVNTQIISTCKSTIDISFLPIGVYYLKTTGEGQSFPVLKTIIER